MKWVFILDADVLGPWYSNGQILSFSRPRPYLNLHIHDRVFASVDGFLSSFLATIWLSFHSHPRNEYFVPREARFYLPGRWFYHFFSFEAWALHWWPRVHFKVLSPWFSSIMPQKMTIECGQVSSWMDHELDCEYGRCFRMAMKSIRLLPEYYWWGCFAFVLNFFMSLI